MNVHRCLISLCFLFKYHHATILIDNVEEKKTTKERKSIAEENHTKTNTHTHMHHENTGTGFLDILIFSFFQMHEKQRIKNKAQIQK